jgi:4-hydroxybenzoate polyprenyltransferase
MIAVILSYAATVITVATICSFVLYSVPPLRLKRYPMLSAFLVASGALLAFTLGFYAEQPQVDYPSSLAYAILICFTLAFNTKDLKDYEGDKKSRVWTIPVIFGLKKGRMIIAALDLLAYSLVPTILGLKSAMFPALAFGLATFLVVLRKESREWQVFLLYFTFLALLPVLK